MLDSALGRTIAEVHYENTPLERVIADLRKRLGINIHVQWAELDDFGVTKNTPIRVRLKHVSAGRLLRLVLETASNSATCAYEIHDGVVIVSTDGPTQRRLVLRTYRVRNLVREGEWATAPADPLRQQIKERIASLTQLITDSVQPDAWVQGGGIGTLKAVDGKLRDLSAAAVLRIALDDLTGDTRWGFEIDEGVLVIASAEFLYRRMFVHVFEVADLTRARIEPETLIDLLTNSVEPDTWVMGGGLGTVQVFRDRLVVHNDLRIHREVTRVLEQLRNANTRSQTKPNSP